MFAIDLPAGDITEFDRSRDRICYLAKRTLKVEIYVAAITLQTLPSIFTSTPFHTLPEFITVPSSDVRQSVTNKN